MKRLRFIFCATAAFIYLYGSASAETFEGKGSLRVEACKAAKDRGRMGMENKYTGSIKLPGERNKVIVGECDCSEDKKEFGYSHWTCIVDAEIAAAEKFRGVPPQAPKKRAVQVVSQSGRGETQLQACDAAKWNAAKAVQAWGGVVVDAGSCSCGLSGLSGALLRYECNVDAKYEKQ